MSSNQPTELGPRRPARWRSPAGWSMRTRIVATMMVLLTLLGIAVGSTAEIFLHRSLYQQLDSKLFEAQQRTRGFFDNQKTGHLVSRLTTDLVDVGEVAHHGPSDARREAGTRPARSVSRRSQIYKRTL